MAGSRLATMCPLSKSVTRPELSETTTATALYTRAAPVVECEGCPSRTSSARHAAPHTSHHSGYTMIQKSLQTFAGALALLLAVAFSASTAIASDVPRMSKEDLKSKLANPDVLIIDVRTEKDWKNTALKIKGALREDPSKSKTWIDKIPKEKTLVLYCA